MEQVVGWVLAVRAGLDGPFSVSMRFGVWLPGLPFRCQSLPGLPMAGMAAKAVIMGEDATELVSMGSRTLFQPAGRDGVWLPTESKLTPAVMRYVARLSTDSPA